MTVDVTLPGLQQQADALGLWLSGAFHEGDSTVVLISPGPDFWPRFTAAPEYNDGAPEPMDRWSARVIGTWAARLGATALFPFGDTPAPFMAMAQASGRAWSSPVHLLVHDAAGLMISYRGALRLSGRLALPAPTPRPCDSCAKPCLDACPIGALGGKGYDVPACQTYLRRPEGATCLSQGCAVRRACPLSQTHGRKAEQSAFHMRAFL